MPTKARKARRKRGAPDPSTRARRNFLQIDSEIALTFSGIALSANDREKRKRTTQTARTAYDTILRLRKDIDLTEVEEANLDRNLLRLKEELQSLGESV